MNIVVGCPIRDRGWVFNEWLEHVLAAFDVMQLTPSFAFVVGDSRDDTQAQVSELFRTYKGMWIEEKEDQPYIRPGFRIWNEVRYDHMVYVRNRLLECVRFLEPDYFLSLDSDILIHPSALALMLSDIQSGVPSSRGRIMPNAVGTKVFLNGVQKLPNYLHRKKTGGFLREDQNGCFKVDVLMALKLMDIDAYMTNYRSHAWGEDIGWSDSCIAKGLKLVWDGRITSKHVMDPQALAEIDPRIGW